MPKFDVVVGNIGNVYSGGDYRQAIDVFKNYKIQSQANCGRAAGESVVLMEDGEILKEHTGRIKTS